MKRLVISVVLFALPGITLAQSVTWDVSLWGKRRAFTEHIERLAELVELKTNGGFTLRLSYGGLSEPKKNLDGIARGEFEMAQFCAGYHKEKTPSITVMELPYLGVETLDQERVISQYLYRHPAVLRDFRRWNAIALMPSPLPQYNLVGTGQVPRQLSDLNGLRIRATGGIGKAMEAIGAEPKSIVATKVKEALDSGALEAVAFAPHAHVSFGTIARGEWWTTNLNPGSVHCPVVANVDAVKRLKPAHLEALYSSINESLDYYISNYTYNMNASWEPVLDRLGIERVTFTDSELSAFRTQVERPTARQWIEENTRLGLPAKDIYRLVKIALSGGNPEIGISENIVWIDSDNRVEEASKEEIVSAFSFDKRPGSDSTIVESSSDSKRLMSPQAPRENLFTKTGSKNSGVTVNIPELRDEKYFGVPRNGVETLSADPLEMSVEWQLDESATVGSVVRNLAEYIGYALTSSDPNAIVVYDRKLPRIQRTVPSITVADAFELVAGSGFMTLFDHSARTIQHVSTMKKSTASLPECPDNIAVASLVRAGVLQLQDGTECRFRG